MLWDHTAIKSGYKIFFSQWRWVGFNYSRVFLQSTVHDTRFLLRRMRWRQLIWEERTLARRSLPFGLLFLLIAFLPSACVSGLNRTKAIYAWWALNDDLMIGNRWQTSVRRVCGSRCPLLKVQKLLNKTLLPRLSQRGLNCFVLPDSRSLANRDQRPWSWATACRLLIKFCRLVHLSATKMWEETLDSVIQVQRSSLCSCGLLVGGQMSEVYRTR